MTVKKLVVVIKDVDTNEVLERWQFDVEGDKEALKDGYVTGQVLMKCRHVNKSLLKIYELLDN